MSPLFFLYVSRLSPTYLSSPVLHESSVLRFIVEPKVNSFVPFWSGAIVIFALSVVSVLFSNAFNCLTVTASVSSAPSSSWLILLLPTETTYPLSLKALFVKYDFPFDSVVVTFLPNATEFLKVAFASAPRTVPPSAVDFDPDPNTTLALASVFNVVTPLVVSVSPTVAPLPIATE